MIVQDEILDAEEVGKLLKLHPRTIKRLAGQHEIPGFQVAGKWRFRRQDIDTYIEEQIKQEQDKGENG